MFVNTLALRNYPSGEKRINRFLEEVGRNTLTAFENQDYPLEELVEKLGVVRESNRNPLFDTMFILQNLDATEFAIPGLTVSMVPLERKTAKFALTLEAREVKEELQIGLNYRTSLFIRENIEQIALDYQKIIETVIREPDLKIKDIPLFSQISVLRQAAISVEFNF
jgi:non-ribosomal peptide synthetase component F